MVLKMTLDNTTRLMDKPSNANPESRRDKSAERKRTRILLADSNVAFLEFAREELSLHPDIEVVYEPARDDKGNAGHLVLMLDKSKSGAWLVKAQVKPFIDWIWGGCLVMALGGLLAASDRRYRFSLKKESILAEARA